MAAPELFAIDGFKTTANARLVFYQSGRLVHAPFNVISAGYVQDLLGISDFALTYLDDADAATTRATLGLSDGWAVQPIGVPVPVMDDITGVAQPPTDQDYRYIKLTAADAYNTGVLTGESVSGSAPLVVATATVSLSGSPINGQTVHLINTERRFLRAGSAGTVQNDQLQQMTGTLSRAGSNRVLFNGGSGVFNTPSGSEAYLPASTSSASVWNGNVEFDSAGSARSGTETRAKNIGVTFYMRVL